RQARGGRVRQVPRALREGEAAVLAGIPAMAIRLLAAALVVGILAGPALAAPRPRGPPKGSAALLSEGASIEPGAPFWLGLRQRIAPGWHTYWLNPGDSGEAPTLDWKLPAGFAA